MIPPPPILAISAAAGLALGSYATTAGLRWARGEPSALGRSHCDACGRTLGFVRTLPLVSYVATGGACARCRGRIDPLHPAGELAGIAVLVGAAWRLDPLRTPLLAALGLVLVALAATDLRAGRLPDRLTLAVAVLSAALAALRSPDALLRGAVAALAALALLSALRAASARLKGEPGLGLGDVKLIGALALWLGAATPWAVAAAALVGLAAAAVARPADRRLPFGPALAASAWATGLAVELGTWPTTA